MLEFVHRDQQSPDKREAKERRMDFAEIYARFSGDRARAQASRCSQCGVPFCQDHCPLGNNIPDWLMLVAENRLREAYEVSSATNAMPEICGRICPQDRLCEGSCVIEQSGHGTVTIGAVEQYITETAWDNGWVEPLAPKSERAQSVGIIGAGPAGFAAAEELRMQGVQVEIYDRYDRAGGLLTYGIPEFKLEKHVVARRTARLEKAGVKFHYGVNVGGDLRFGEMRARHDAVLIATGVYKARELACPGVGNAGVVAALDYLTASNRVCLGDTVAAFDDGTLNAKDKSVVVIGGGDTAMDCVRTAIRQGAKSVTCAYRRDRANMPGSAREVTNAEEEGVVFSWLTAPRAIAGDADCANGVRLARMELGPPDESGRRAPVEVADADTTIEADLVIKALGFEPEPLPSMFAEPSLVVTPRGTIKVDGETMETSLPGVYAAGDIVRGASLVVWAIKDGRDAAHSIIRFLCKQSAPLAAE